MFLARNMYSKDQMDFISIIYLASKGYLSIQYTDHWKLIKANERFVTKSVKFHYYFLNTGFLGYWIKFLRNKALASQTNMYCIV